MMLEVEDQVVGRLGGILLVGKVMNSHLEICVCFKPDLG